MDYNSGESKVEKYKFSNRAMFAIVMQDSSLCKQFIERIFPGRKIAKIEMLTTEKTITMGIKSKSVRLDAMFEGDDKVYDIEMQVATEDALPQRVRYYHSAIDRQILNAGDNYEDLRDCYVIFVCRYDPFGRGQAVYQFETIDKKLNLKLEDGCNTIILNTKCSVENVPEELRTLFEYIEHDKVEQDTFVHEIDNRVAKANLDEEVRGIMTVEQEMRAQYRIGCRKGQKDEKIAIAKKLKVAGIAPDIIAEVTELSLDEIERLQ